MKKVSKQHLVLKRNTLKTLTEVPRTAYRRVVGGEVVLDCCNKSQPGNGCITTETSHGAN